MKTGVFAGGSALWGCAVLVSMMMLASLHTGGGAGVGMAVGCAAGWFCSRCDRRRFATGVVVDVGGITVCFIPVVLCLGTL